VVAIIIDITDKLTLLRRARRLAKDVQRSQLRMAQGLLQATEDEVKRQMQVLCDQEAGKDEVDAAIEIMPLLTKLLLQRREKLGRLEAEFLGNPYGDVEEE
jgi:hypothetical protein